MSGCLGERRCATSTTSTTTIQKSDTNLDLKKLSWDSNVRRRIEEPDADGIIRIEKVELKIIYYIFSR